MKMKWIGVMTCVATVMLGPARARAQVSIVAFENVSVIPMDRERVFAGQTVVVQGDRIVTLGPVGQVRVPANATRIDGRGKFLMPGLADMHMHVGYSITDVRDAEHTLLLLLAYGVTTIRNLDYGGGSNRNFPGDELLRLRARIAAGELLGPRIYTAGKWYADSSKSVLANVQAYKAAGYDLIKVHDRVNTPLAKLDSLVEAARQVGVPIAGHAVGGLEFGLRHRFASIEHMEGFPGQETAQRSLADTSHIPAVVAAIRQAGVYVTPTRAIIEAFTSGEIELRYYEPRSSVPAKLRRLYGYADRKATAPLAADSSAPPRDTTTATRGAAPANVHGSEVRRRLILALQKAGVGLLLGTDSPLLIPGYGVHQELDALVRAGLTPYEALLTGTRNVAAYFGTLDSTGTVAVGKRADLVLLAANRLTDIRNAERITGVMAAGRWFEAAEIQRRLATYGED